MFTPLFTPRVNTLYCFEEWRGKQRISPPGDKFTPGGQLRPWVKSLPLGAKLRIGHCFLEWIINFFSRHEKPVRKLPSEAVVSYNKTQFSSLTCQYKLGRLCKFEKSIII
jgi:hypothetical protein